MPKLGEIRKCKGLTVFRVDRSPIKTGERVRRYAYMQPYAGLISQLQAVMEAGPTSLAQYLSKPDWQHLELANETVVSESDVMKMCIVLEAIFEHARTKVAPTLPNRLDCVFVWPSFEIADHFREQYLPEGVIHRCLITQGEAVALDGGLLPPGIDLSDLSQRPFSAEYRAIQLRAETYWKAKESPTFPELLVLGDVEVIGLETGY